MVTDNENNDHDINLHYNHNHIVGREPIKISTKGEGDKYTNKNERRFRKENLNVDRANLFTDPIIDISDENFEKMEEFTKYCDKIRNCIHCKNGKISMKRFSSNPDNEIIMSCGECLNNTIDSSSQGKEYVAWFNRAVLDDYDMTFQRDGFPKLIRYTYMGICHDCKVPHEKKKVGFMDLR